MGNRSFKRYVFSRCGQVRRRFGVDDGNLSSGKLAARAEAA
jgi:hypothetical protein